MALTLNVSPSAEQAFRAAWGNQLDRAALEALLIEGYREGKLSIGKLTELLGMATTHDADAWLASRGVALNYTADDFIADCRSIDTLRSANR